MLSPWQRLTYLYSTNIIFLVFSEKIAPFIYIGAAYTSSGKMVEVAS